MGDNNKKCAPSKQFDGETCFTMNDIVELVIAYNKFIDSIKNKHLNVKWDVKNSGKINLKWDPSKEQNDATIRRYKKDLMKELIRRLTPYCGNDQVCWLQQDFIKFLPKEKKEIIVENTFRPKGPNGKFTWLSTVNVNQVMRQYEEKHKDFQFFGAVPIDFKLFPSFGMTNPDFDALQHGGGKTKFGVVFNLDEHYKSGSHWVGLYINIKSGEIYFFDSYGGQPEERIEEFVADVKTYLERNNIVPKYEWNQHRHQYKNSECGVYSIDFIIRLLEGETFEKITTNITDDDTMNSKRQILFRNT